MISSHVACIEHSATHLSRPVHLVVSRVHWPAWPPSWRAQSASLAQADLHTLSESLHPATPQTTSDAKIATKTLKTLMMSLLPRDS
jgi:hypothetical protein